MRTCKNAFLLGLCLFLGSCNNILRDFSDKTKDQYKIDSAKKYIDEEKFDDAINIIKPVWDKNPKDPEVGYVTAVAYAGRAGLRIITLVNQLVSNLDRTGVLRIFAEHFAGAGADQLSDIETALTVIETVGTTPSQRDGKMNFFALFVFYSRIGVVLAKNALSGTALRANFTACHTVVDMGGAMTGISNSEIDKIYTSLGRIIDVAAYVATGGDLDDLVATGGIPAGITTTEVCNATPNDPRCLLVRTFVNQGKSDSGIGLGVSPGNAVNHPAGYLCATITP